MLAGVTAIAALFLCTQIANADKGDQGADNSGDYQGATFVRGQGSDKFGITQIGGYYDGSFHEQKYYNSQVSTGIAQGLRMHTYIYSQFSTKSQADEMLNYYLPKVQTPKNSIVALDVESGSPTTEAVQYALKKVKDAGYTAVLYGYKNFLTTHLDLSSLSAQYPLWLAEYPDYNVTTSPNYNYFPSFDNIGVFQFTSTYKSGGLDGNVDLTSLTNNGYKGTTTSTQGGVAVKTDTTTSAVKEGQKANNTSKSAITNGYTVKVNFSASKWSNGTSIPSWVKGKSYEVIQTSGDKVLLGGILSWINKSNVEILQTSSQTTSQNSSASVSGTFTDGSYVIHREDGYFTPNQTLRVFAYPGVQPTGAKYYAGEPVKYDGYIVRGNYVYASYLTNGGYHHYIAVRQNGVALGTFK
ncbi:1,4-beta-N-acetylmuramidase [Liquorilactobacillus satsumensis]|uniref:GH25 family lysozyme n=1 Tax=Lactobacillaceae TaxID=33958 RepID=UPI0021C450FC|nr:GH25 family lysozyme [Liquorilactobacillus satsumensis]MCP9313711.1 1,4-beta-N-acetylmuramidase [Liquorilactobacillus satsumensis]MCP9360852.1 1,4-beta-N-acetylmuramidase [Liquorilactobacillus satsumensis]